MSPLDAQSPRPARAALPVKCCTGRCNQGRDCPLLPKRVAVTSPWPYVALVAMAIGYLLVLVVQK